MGLTVPPSLSQWLPALPRQWCGRIADFLGGKVDDLFLGVYNMILGFLGRPLPRYSDLEDRDVGKWSEEA